MIQTINLISSYVMMNFTIACILIKSRSNLVLRKLLISPLVIKPKVLLLLILLTKDTEKKLEQLYQDYFYQNQGVKGNKNNNFSFSIIFALEKKLLGEKLKKVMDDYYIFAPDTTKKIKSKPLPDIDLKDVDDDTTKFPIGTRIF